MSAFPLAVPSRFDFTRDVVQPLAADRSKRAIAFVDREGDLREVTFAEVAAASARWTSLLRRLGLERGDRVLVLAGKTLDWHPLLLGVLASGAIAIPCSEELPKTRSGKIRRVELRQLEERRAAGDV